VDEQVVGHAHPPIIPGRTHRPGTGTVPGPDHRHDRRRAVRRDGQVRPAGYARLGGNTVWGEWFAGTIDELNVYNRALTAAEIAVDMNAT
jgi:hypothetical protein